MISPGDGHDQARTTPTVTLCRLEADMADSEQLPVLLAGLQVGGKHRCDEEHCVEGTSSGITPAQAPSPHAPPEPADHVTNAHWDWTEALPDNGHVRFLKSVKWSDTLLGSIHGWPPVLRQAVYQVIADSRPATLYW
jgi:hypothetical protein